MDRPRSIRLFEALWFGSALLWSLGTRLAWDRTQNSLAADPRTVPVAGWAQWFIVGVVAFTTLLLWWLAARRANVIGKWLVVAMTTLSGLRVLILAGGLLTSRTLHPLSHGSFFLAAALTIASAAMLFRDDARAWFGEVDPSDEEPA